MRRIFTIIATALAAIWWALGFVGNLQTAQSVIQDRGATVRTIFSILIWSQWVGLAIFIAGVAVLAWMFMSRPKKGHGLDYETMLEIGDSAATHPPLHDAHELNRQIIDARTKHREESDRAIEECLERYSKVHSGAHLMAESLISASAHKLKSNNDLLILCERIKGFGNDNPLDHWRDYVPDDDALKFLQRLAYGPEKFPEHPTPPIFHGAMEKWRTDHGYPEPSHDRRLDALADKVLGPPFILPAPIPPFRVTSLDTYIEGESKLVAQLFFQNDGTSDRTVLSIRTIYWDPKRIWRNSHMFLGEDGGSMRIGNINNAFVLPPRSKQTFIHSIIVPDEFLKIPEAEFGVQIASTREISGEVQDVNFPLLRVITDKESGQISHAIHMPKNVSLDDPTPPS